MKRIQGRPRKQDRDDVAATLIKAAQHQMSENFTDDIKVRSIASDAGVNPAMINYYFGGKTGLFISVLQDAIIATCRQLQELMTIEHTPEELLEKVMTMMDQHFMDTIYLRNMGFREMTQPSTDIHDAYTRRIGHLIHRQITKLLTPIYAKYPDAVERAHTASYMILSAASQPFWMRNTFSGTYLMEPDGAERIRCRKMIAAMLAPCDAPDSSVAEKKPI